VRGLGLVRQRRAPWNGRLRTVPLTTGGGHFIEDVVDAQDAFRSGHGAQHADVLRVDDEQLDRFLRLLHREVLVLD
jgi:hypothetical protein